MVIAVMGLLAAGCSPKPYLGKPRDLHEAMGSRGEAVEAPQLEASPAALGPEVPYLPLVQPARSEAGVGDGAPERGRGHDCGALGVPDAGAVVVVSAIPGAAQAGTDDAGTGSGGSAEGEMIDG